MCCKRDRLTPCTWYEGKVKRFRDQFCWLCETLLSQGQQVALPSHTDCRTSLAASSKDLLGLGCSSAKTSPPLHHTWAEQVSGKPALPFQIMVSETICDLPHFRLLSQNTCRGFLTPPCEEALNHSQQLS